MELLFNKVHIFIFVSIQIAFGQTNDINDLQYGVALKTTIDLNTTSPNYNIAFTGGIGGHPFDYAEAFPSIHSGFIIYNKGDLVSSYNPDRGFFTSSTFDFFIDFTLTLGYYTQHTNFEKRFVPLYHFSDFTPNPLQNPFQHSLTLGTNVIWFWDKYKKEQPQRVGFTGIMIDRRIQASTYNDGSIWGRFGLGDGLDRFYTGGGMVSYHLNNNNLFNKIELSFHKFTGHEKYVFDTANLLQLDFIPFKNPETYYYSHSRFRGSITSYQNDFGLHITAHNTDKDPQDWIHFTGDDVYHPDLFGNQRGIYNEFKRLALGGFYLYNNLKFEN